MIREKENTVTIHTPEGIVFHMFLAGPVTRFLAWLIDIACIVAAASFTGSLLKVLGVISLDLSRAFSMVSYFVISIGYGIATEWLWRGQTIGKRILRLRVMDIQGLKLQFSQVVIRNLARFLDSLPVFYVVGGLSCLLSRRAQRLGDLAANTIVIRTPKIRDPDLDQLLSGKYNSLRSYPYLAARVRYHISPSEADIALQALLRRDELNPEARVKLFDKISSHFRSIVTFPEEAVLGITDEQYVRNVVDIVYRTDMVQKEHIRGQV